jgi:hypothetical protein
MNYLEDQRQKAILARDLIFKDPCGGIFRNLEREFVLSNPSLNIWAGVRENTIAEYDLIRKKDYLSEKLRKRTIRNLFNTMHFEI